MSGRQLADALRRRPALNVLFTMGYTLSPIVHEGRFNPGVQLIAKPFTFGELGVAVRALLDKDA